jgi:hypothetical protein
LTEGTAYFARNVTTNTFEVSTMSGGASIATSGTQSGIFNVMTGSDSNSGLVNSASGALLTLQAAYNIVTSSLDLGGKNVTISAAAAPFTAGVLISQPWTGGGRVILEGNSAARISASGNVINWTCALPGQLTIQNFDGLSTSSGSVIRGEGPGFCSVGSNNYGPVTQYCVAALSTGCSIRAQGSTSLVLGGAANFFNASAAGYIRWDTNTIILVDTPAFSSAFAAGSFCGTANFGAITFSGAATGPRFSAGTNSVLSTSGGGATYFPGNSAGSGTNSSASPWGLYV